MRTKLLVMLALLAVSLPAHPYDFALNHLYYSFTPDGKAVSVSGGNVFNNNYSGSFQKFQ